MVPLSTTRAEGLFERDAPLSSFSKLIRVGYAFGLISDTVRLHCDYIREIRNAFAHSKVYIEFETPEIKAACLLLPRYYEKFEGGMSPDHPRARFIGTTTRLMDLFALAANDPNASLPLDYRD